MPSPDQRPAIMPETIIPVPPGNIELDPEVTCFVHPDTYIFPHNGIIYTYEPQGYSGEMRLTAHKNNKGTLAIGLHKSDGKLDTYTFTLPSPKDPPTITRTPYALIIG